MVSSRTFATITINALLQMPCHLDIEGIFGVLDEMETNGEIRVHRYCMVKDVSSQQEQILKNLQPLKLVKDFPSLAKLGKICLNGWKIFQANYCCHSWCSSWWWA